MPRLPVVLSLLFVGWLILGAPVPGVGVKPLEPNRALPTFEQRIQETAVLRDADARGLLERDPARDIQRQAVLDAFERLKFSPCDAGRRREFAETTRPFVNSASRDQDMPPAETYEVEGRTLNATRYLDREARDAIMEALRDGYLALEELPGAAGFGAAIAKMFARTDPERDRFGMASRCTGQG